MNTMTDRFALAITAGVVAAGAYVGYMQAERRWQCGLGAAVLALAWLIRHAFRGSTPARMEARRSITHAIIYAGLLLGVGLVEALGWVAASGEFRIRASQCLAGVFVMVLGNVIPKKAVTSPRRAALMRANGRALVLGGLGYALAWRFVPLAYANAAGMAVMLSAMAYVVLRIVSCAVRRQP